MKSATSRLFLLTLIAISAALAQAQHPAVPPVPKIDGALPEGTKLEKSQPEPQLSQPIGPYSVRYLPGLKAAPPAK
jgi:hypothetical protein